MVILSNLARTGRGESSLPWGLLQLLDWLPGLPIFPKSGVIWPLQVDLVQQLGHLWHFFLQNSSDLHRKHHSHILFLDDEECQDLHLSLAATHLQKEHELHHMSSQVKNLLSLCCRLQTVLLPSCDSTFKLFNFFLSFIHFSQNKSRCYMKQIYKKVI